MLGVLLGHREPGPHVDDGDVEGEVDLVAGTEGLGEVVAGVEEEHVDPRGVLRDEVGEDPGLHAARHGEGAGEGPGRPTRRPRRPARPRRGAHRPPRAPAGARSSGGCGWRRRSSQLVLVDPVGPGREGLAGAALGEEAADEPLDVGPGRSPAVTLRPRTVRPRPASSRSAEASPPPRCTWKPGRCSPSTSDELALEPDVGDLDAGAGVGAAVDVQADRGVEVAGTSRGAARARPRPSRRCLGVDDGELAELDAGAGHRVAAAGAGTGPRARGRRARRRGPRAGRRATSITTSFWCGVSRSRSRRPRP